MTLVQMFVGLFVTPSPEKQDEMRLNRAKLELTELECNLEATRAHRDMLKARIERLESVRTDRPARSSIQAPHPGPARANVGAFNLPDAAMARSRA